MSEDEALSESGAADRLIFFSDAVVAIAITLLALDLPVPTGTTVDELWSSVQDHKESYLAFVISFVVIAAMWSEHHHVFRYAARSDAWLRSLDLVWLLMVVLNPFATKLLTSEAPDTVGAHALRWGFYALLQILASVTFLAMVHHMMSHDLQAADTPSLLVSEAGWGSYGVLLGSGCPFRSSFGPVGMGFVDRLPPPDAPGSPVSKASLARGQRDGLIPR
jgi:uncharacterized membrane protein